MEEGMCKEFTPPWQLQWSPYKKSKACELIHIEMRYQQRKRSRVNGGFMYGNYLLSASMHLSWNTWNIDAFDKHKFIHVDIPSTLASRYM